MIKTIGLPKTGDTTILEINLPHLHLPIKNEDALPDDKITENRRAIASFMFCLPDDAIYIDNQRFLEELPGTPEEIQASQATHVDMKADVQLNIEGWVSVIAALQDPNCMDAWVGKGKYKDPLFNRWYMFNEMFAGDILGLYEDFDDPSHDYFALMVPQEFYEPNTPALESITPAVVRQALNVLAAEGVVRWEV